MVIAVSVGIVPRGKLHHRAVARVWCIGHPQPLDAAPWSVSVARAARHPIQSELQGVSA